jgi:hypothetical protein
MNGTGVIRNVRKLSKPGWLWLGLASLAVVTVLVGLACGGGSGAEETVVIDFSTPRAQETPSPTPTATPTPTPTPTPGPEVCGTNPDPAPESLLQIEEPKRMAEVSSPFHVRGWGSTIGKDDIGVVVAIVDANQKVVQDFVVPPQPRTYRLLPPGLANTDDTRPFGIDISLAEVEAPTAYCVWAFLTTTERGVPQDVVQVPVVLKP